MPKAIRSLQGYIRKISDLSEKNSGLQLLYRGHSNVDYKISPSVFRNKNHVSSEHLMIRQLVAQHPTEFSADDGIFDQLVRAQHYGLPTRLLDVSLNPLVALYFAVCSSPSKRASVVVFKPNVGKQRYYDSDVVSCLSALSLLTEGEKNTILTEARQSSLQADQETWLIHDVELKRFNSVPEVAKLIQLIRHEKPDFRPIIQPLDLARPVAVTPRKKHSRIIAQNGAFIIFGLVPVPNEVNMSHIEYEQIHIDEGSKAEFQKELSQVGISESSMFPEIEKAALAIKKRYE